MLFWKMNGLGNDYIFIDVERFASKKEKEYLDNNIEKLTRNISDRHFGVGSDGVVLILPSDTADVKMRIFNADGSEGKMCGNAVRCVAKYLFDSGIRCADEYMIGTLSGIKQVKVCAEGDSVTSATVNMGRITSCKIEEGVFSVDIGNPHIVVLTDISHKYAFSMADNLCSEYDANIEFVKKIGANTIDVRVYERGSGVTMACGTGATAAAYVAYVSGMVNTRSIDVALPGGILKVDFNGDNANLTGDVRLNYIGEVRLW